MIAGIDHEWLEAPMKTRRYNYSTCTWDGTLLDYGICGRHGI